MARKRRDNNSRRSRNWGKQSGVTIGTIPSGVTITTNGILYDDTTGITPTELGYLDGMAGPALGSISSSSTGLAVTGGTAAWTGTSVSINLTNLGISTIYGLSAQYMTRGGTSVGEIVATDTVTGVSLAVCTQIDGGGVTSLPSGGTVFWMAIHS